MIVPLKWSNSVVTEPSNIGTMNYIELFRLLKSRANYSDHIIPVVDSVEIRNHTFVSESHSILPGSSTYRCDQHQLNFNEEYLPDTRIGHIDTHIDIPDIDITENKTFRYHIFKPVGVKKCSEVVLFFHGFNEKYWDKYLPWAQYIASNTGKAVVLFPIAFHMNRAPQLWSDAHRMYKLSAHRRNLFPDSIDSTLSNVAISTRLHALPQRFLWSGLQTYYDVIQFVNFCKEDKHPDIASNFTCDFFSYSVGSLLAQILKLTNYNNYFGNSKLVMFCGGAVFNRLSPVSKFIIDSEANLALYNYLIEHLERHIEKNNRLEHLLGQKHTEGLIFRSMLNYSVMREFREDLFRSAADKILAIALKNDSIIPYYEVAGTLQGSNRDIPVNFQTLDFEYTYRHEDPFPVKPNLATEVDNAFNEVFSAVSNFLKS